jgi:hypothetical protein
MLFLALPICVYELTGSAPVTGTVFAAGLLPDVLFGSVARVFVGKQRGIGLSEIIGRLG